MNRLRLTLSVLPAALFLLTTSARSSTLYGDTITCSATLFTCSSPTAVAGSGLEFTVTTFNFGDTLDADFTSTGLILSDPAAVGTGFNNVGFPVGFTLSFTDSTNAFTSATFLGGTVPGSFALNAGDVSISGGTVTINTNDVLFSGGDTDTIGLTTTSPVPEPTTAVLLGVPLMGLLWRRFREYGRSQT
jgi:hypothetical protein